MLLLRRFSLISASKPLSLFFSTQSQSPPNPNSPPLRKARQSARRILHLLSSHPQNPTLSQTLKTLEFSPQSLSTSQASILITAISNPLISFDFYQFLISLKPGFRPDSVLYMSLIKSQLDSINPKLYKIKFYFREMRKHNVRLSGEDLQGLVELAVPNCVEIAGFLVREGLEKVEFDETSYWFVVSVYAKHGMFKDAILVAERGRMRLGKPGSEFYGCVMGVYRLSGDARAAVELFLEMEERGVVADEGIYRVLLEILLRVGWAKLCWVFLEEMRGVGYNVDENLAMELVRAFVKEEMVSEAGCFFKEGILKDSESLAVWVEAMVEKGKPLEAAELVRNMQDSGLSIDGCVYALLIRGCGKTGLIKDAELIVEEVRSLEGITNRELVYSSLICVYSKAEMRKMTETVFDEMEATVGLKGSEEVFLHMMSMYGVLGLLDDLLRMFNEWKKISCRVSIDVYAVVIDALSKSGKLNQASDVLFEMRSLGIQPNNSIYSSMMIGYLQLGLTDGAVALIDEYMTLGLEVDDVVVSSIVRTLIQADRYMELGVYIDKLIIQGIKISRDQGATDGIVQRWFLLEKVTKIVPLGYGKDLNVLTNVFVIERLSKLC